MSRVSLMAGTAGLLLLAACNEPGPDMAAENAGTSELNDSQRAFADANARMHAAMSEIPTDADEAFMRGMLAHHRGAVEMAQVELAHGSDPVARDLAQRILDAQSEEIAEMETWLADHDIDTTRDATGGAHAGH